MLGVNTLVSGNNYMYKHKILMNKQTPKKLASSPNEAKWKDLKSMLIRETSIYRAWNVEDLLCIWSVYLVVYNQKQYVPYKLIFQSKWMFSDSII